MSLVTSTVNAGGPTQGATATGTAAGGPSTTIIVVPGAGPSANGTGVAPTGGYTPVPTVVPSGMPTPITANGAGAVTGSFVAGFVAIFAAVLAL